MRNWDLLLSRAEFTYNSSINRIIGMSSFKIVYGHHPRKSVDLILVPLYTRTFETTESFAQYVTNLHKEIVKKINVSNQIYKQLADSHQQAHNFAEGDYVMIRIRLEWFPSRTVKKLHTCGVGPFRILKKIGPNVYIVDLPSDYSISSTFNVLNLVKYKEPITIPSDPFEPNPSIESEPQPECPQSKFSAKHDHIERILDEQMISTKRKRYQRYLIHWQGRSEYEDT